MIEKKIIEDVVNAALQGTDGYLVEVTVSKDNDIEVEIDSDSGVDIDTCVAINNAIENALDRDVEDYSLQVGSSGLTSPFKVKRQYDRNVGNEVEVLSGSKKYVGELKSVDDETFTIETEVKVKGEKKPQKQTLTFKYSEVKYTKYNLKFN
ncbi:MAG: ribosome assembly cofactor RimP [Paludibacteraceae bacterium]|nr:ribosome assembly cofactor RimP [Paludibacteraceae bacterium]